MRSADLILQFRDDFSKEYGPPDYFDLTWWTKIWGGEARTEGGYWLMEALRPPPPGPGVMSFGGFATRQKHFNPGLAGANGVEITLVDYTHEEDYPRGLEDQIVRNHIMGWGLTIASWQGLVGSQNDHQKDRGVQIHIDLMQHGLYVSLVRGIVPDDWDKYQNDGLSLESAVANGAITPGDLEKYGEFGGLSEIKWRTMQDKLIEQGTFISYPCLVVACRVYRPDHEFHTRRSHRYGLYLTDDANTLYWTLDGHVMDTSDITGYFSFSPKSVRDGAFLTIAAAGIFQRNTWIMDNLELYVSELRPLSKR